MKPVKVVLATPSRFSYVFMSIPSSQILICKAIIIGYRFLDAPRDPLAIAPTLFDDLPLCQ